MLKKKKPLWCLIALGHMRGSILRLSISAKTITQWAPWQESEEEGRWFVGSGTLRRLLQKGWRPPSLAFYRNVSALSKKENAGNFCHIVSCFVQMVQILLWLETWRLEIFFVFIGPSLNRSQSSFGLLGKPHQWLQNWVGFYEKECESSSVVLTQLLSKSWNGWAAGWRSGASRAFSAKGA